MIDTRGKMDMYLFIFMAILTLIVIYVLLYYVKPMLTLSNLMKSKTVPDVALNTTNSTNIAYVGSAKD